MKKKSLSADNDGRTKYSQLFTTCNYGYEQELDPLHSEIDSLRPCNPILYILAPREIGLPAGRVKQIAVEVTAGRSFFYDDRVEA